MISWLGCLSEFAHYFSNLTSYCFNAFPLHSSRRHIKLTTSYRFFAYWSQNEDARLKRDLANANYLKVVPVTIEDFFRRHKFDELATAVDKLTFTA